MDAKLYDEQFWPRVCLGLMLAALLIGVNIGYMAALHGGNEFVVARGSQQVCASGIAVLP